MNADEEESTVQLITLNLSSVSTQATLKSRLEPIFDALHSKRDDAGEKKFALRIKLDLVEGSKDSFDFINQILIKICLLQVVEFGFSYVKFDRVEKFFIEVQNTFDDKIMKVPLIAFLWRHNCKDNNKMINRILEENVSIDGFDPSTLDATLRYLLLTKKEDDCPIPRPIGVINPCHLTHIGLRKIYRRKYEAIFRDHQDSNARNSAVQNLDALFNACKIGNIDGINEAEVSQFMEEASQEDQAINEDREQVRIIIQQKVEQEDWTRNLNKLIISKNAFISSYNDIKELNRFSELDFLNHLQSNLEEDLTNIKDDPRDTLLSIFEEDPEQHNNRKESEEDDFDEDQAPNEDLKTGDDDMEDDRSDASSLVDQIDMEPRRNNDGEEMEEDQEQEDGDHHSMISDYNYYHLNTFMKQIEDICRQKRSYYESRQEIGEYMLKQTKTYAFKQLISLVKVQNEYIKSKNSLDNNQRSQAQAILRNNEAIVKNIKKWNQSSFCWFYFKRGALKLLYSSKSAIPNSIEHLLSEQIFQDKVRKSELSDLKNQTDFISEVCESIFDLPSEEMDKKKQSIIDKTTKMAKSFRMTKDNYHKLHLITERAEKNIPIILMGESGCGKTFMVEFISTIIMGDEYRPITFHSGVSEKAFIDFVKECIDLANQLQAEPRSKGESPRRVWMFLDEINTNVLVCLISELITERRMSVLGSDDNCIPDNLVIIAACNPFKVRKSKNLAAFGDQVLTHKVYPLPQSLLSFCFNYGQLSEHDEREYIASMIDDARFGGLDDGARSALIDCLVLGQNHIRDNDHESAASIRDVRRFIDLTRVLLDQPNDAMCSKMEKQLPSTRRFRQS